MVIDIDKLQTNDGQVPEVPANPRKIDDKSLRRLAESIKAAPRMLQSRPLLVVELGSAYVVMGGNMRLRAARLAGLSEVPVEVLTDYTPAQLREVIIKDNMSYGRDDWAHVDDWDIAELEEWGVTLPGERKVFGHNGEVLYSLKRETSCLRAQHHTVTTSINATPAADGVKLQDVKCDKYLDFIAGSVAEVLNTIIHAPEGWCIVTPPPRRHKVNNFADKLAGAVAELTQISYHAGTFEVHNRDRLHPAISLESPPPVQQCNHHG